MQAVIQLGGNQHLVKKGDEIVVNKLNHDKPTMTIEALVLFDESVVKVGTPTVLGSKVTLKIDENPLKGPKVKVMKFQAKKRVKKLTGHRQSQTKVTITAITAA